MSKAGQNKAFALYGEARQETIVIDGSPKALLKIERSWRKHFKENEESKKEYFRKMFNEPLEQMIKDFVEAKKKEKKH